MYGKIAKSEEEEINSVPNTSHNSAHDSRNIYPKSTSTGME